MSTTTESAAQTRDYPGNWRAGVAGGIFGAILMGGLILLMNAPTLKVAIPSLYTLTPPPNAGIGLVVHISHGAALGVVFAAVIGFLDTNSTAATVGAGAVWGIVTWIGLAALLMPVWLTAVGSPASPPFPNFATPSLLWHLVYGLGLGVVYTLTADEI
ncbi:DUF6789 family protein [Halorhabdus salina]|uniref:DUF6789 family protein n=1 Tax=Halorhabdus salina TaxID=2750670 RepID=UPI0015EE8BCD|nr:DUF6789 family protein [Halorhabdus salina]